MDKHNFRSFVIAVTSSDEYDDFLSHVAVELRPSAVLRLVFANVVTHAAREVLGWLHFYHLEISFQETTWLNFSNQDADFPEDWEEGAVAEEIDPALINEAGLIGRSAQITGDGSLWFVCSHKHSGTEFMSYEVVLRELVKAIRLSDVTAELREQFGNLGRAFAGGAA
jgi:hypothetical protein